MVTKSSTTRVTKSDSSVNWVTRTILASVWCRPSASATRMAPVHGRRKRPSGIALAMMMNRLGLFMDNRQTKSYPRPFQSGAAPPTTLSSVSSQSTSSWRRVSPTARNWRNGTTIALILMLIRSIPTMPGGALNPLPCSSGAHSTPARVVLTRRLTRERWPLAISTRVNALLMEKCAHSCHVRVFTLGVHPNRLLMLARVLLALRSSKVLLF